MASGRFRAPPRPPPPVTRNVRVLRLLREADREGGLQVMAGVGAERDVRLRRGDAVHLVQPAGDGVRELVVGADPDDRHQVVVPGDRVHLADRRQLRDGLRDLWDAVNLGLEQDDGGDHRLPPGQEKRISRLTISRLTTVISGGTLPSYPARRAGHGPASPQRPVPRPRRPSSAREPWPPRPRGRRAGRRDGRACRSPRGRPAGRAAARARPRWPARRRAPGATAAPAYRRSWRGWPVSCPAPPAAWPSGAWRAARCRAPRRRARRAPCRRTRR